MPERTLALVTVDDAWFGAWVGPSILRISQDENGVGTITYDGAIHDSDRGLPHLDGTVLAPFTDAHVHLGLLEPERLTAGGISRVADLGWDPAVASEWPGHAHPWPEVMIAGGLLGPSGGYPSQSGWAPPAAAVAADTPDAALRAIRSMKDAGASLVKITLNSDAGPVWSDALLAYVVERSHELGLPVAAHVQGPGQAARALRAEVDLFAHTPFSEKLDDALIEQLAVTSTWISTLDIHGYGEGGRTFRVALDNLRRFHAAGGRVVYGTDLGNGPLPVGLNTRELVALRQAGLDDEQLLKALAPDAGPGPSRHVTVVPTSPPASGADLIDWLADARALTAHELREATR